tara:strand:- start:493 stop:696 length:204 start_codon:yes stop_codon:yes gene_type:complete
MNIIKEVKVWIGKIERNNFQTCRPPVSGTTEPTYIGSGFLKREHYLGKSFVVKGELVGIDNLIMDGG